MLKRSLSLSLIFSMLASLLVMGPKVSNAAADLEPSEGPFGPNVYIFDPSTPAEDIQRITTEVFNKQETNEFGNDRYAILFKPGIYDANIRVGFYTHVAGLGQMPDDVLIKGGVTADAEWWKNPDGSKNATKNFWRAAENLSIKPASGSNKWAVSQAVPFRRMHVLGDIQLHDGGWASGGFLADSKIDGKVEAGGQQQWFSRNSNWTTWTGGQWNTVFLGIDNPPEDNWPAKPNTVIDQAPIMREKPFLTLDENDQYQVFVPALQADAKGASWTNGVTPGKSIPIDQFYVAYPDKSDASSINAALKEGKHLLFTPGIYHLDQTIRVTNPDTVVLGLGFATLMPHGGVTALSVDDVDGVIIAGLLFDAGSESSAALMEVGPAGSSKEHSANPASLHDLFFRVGGGAAVGKADVSLQINSNNVIGDHFWIWRADHGTDVAWNQNTTTNGLIVNGDHVTIYGLFVEHYHEYQTLWNGDHGRMYFYQSEIPYDVPNQESWMSNNGTVNGFASYKVADKVTSHEAYGLGIYSFFRDAEVKLHSAIEVPATPGVKIHHATSVFLAGKAGSEITHVVNDFGDSVVRPGHRQTITLYNGQVVKVSAINVTGAGNTMAITTKGGTLQMIADAMPLNATDKRVAWSVENVTGEAAIDSTGLLKAISDGTVKVIATAQDGSGIKGEATIAIFGQTATLGNGWSWVRESKGYWALEPNDANTIILTTQEARWTGTSGPNNILLRNSGADEDFAISVKLNFAATAGYEWAGLVVYQDDGNAITLGRGSTNKIRYSQIKDAKQTDKDGADPVAPEDVYLKIEKSGTTYNGYYSSDGMEWHAATDDKNNVVSFTDVSINDLRVGLVVRKVGPASKKAYFSDFKLNGSVVPFWNPVTSLIVTSVNGETEITSKGGTLQMTAEVLPDNVDNKTVIWSVMNPDGMTTDKAVINAEGLLTAMHNGQVKVVAMAVDGSGVIGHAIIDITGQPVLVSSIEVGGEGGATSITSKGGTLQMSALTNPSDADNKTVTWSVYNTDGTDTDLAAISEEGLLTAIKDGMVKVVAAATDGSDVTGSATITISGQTGGGCTSNCGGDGGSTPTDPSTPSTPTEPKNEHQQPVTAADLNQIQDGRAVVSLGKGKTEAVLPIDIVQSIKHSVEVQSGDAAVIIPSAVLQELIGKLQGKMSDAAIIVRIDSVSDGNAGLNGMEYKISGQINNLDIVLVDKDGKETTLSAFPEPVQVVLPYRDIQVDEDLIGIYVYDEAAKAWEYVGGKADTSHKTVTALVTHFSKYAVLEYNKLFADVSSDHWAYRTLKVLAAKHIVKGISDSEFNPNGKTTRAEFVALLVRALGLQAANADVPFADVHSSDWFAADVAAAYHAGLVSGVSVQAFAPRNPITREQMASLIVRAYEYVEGEKSSTKDNLAVLTDQNQISHWAKAELNKAMEFGLMNGKSADQFVPRANATRAETAQAILNLLDQLEN